MFGFKKKKVFNASENEFNSIVAWAYTHAIKSFIEFSISANEKDVSDYSIIIDGRMNMYAIARLCCILQVLFIRYETNDEIEAAILELKAIKSECLNFAIETSYSSKLSEKDKIAQLNLEYKRIKDRLPDIINATRLLISGKYIKDESEWKKKLEALKEQGIVSIE